MPVQAPAGLVGTVQTVERDRCQVLLVTSRGLTVGALDLDRDPPPAGLLRGENSSTLAVTFEDPKAPVEIGDRIVTSGFSELIPRGIYIGRVIAVSPDEEFGMLRVRVDPAVSVGDLGEVQVLK
jgi:rod shape-determining protein MreC